MSTSAHLGQAMSGTAAAGGLVEAIRSFSICRTLGEAAMPRSSALASVVKLRAAMAIAARVIGLAISRRRFVFIFGTFFQVVSSFSELFLLDILNTPRGAE